MAANEEFFDAMLRHQIGVLRLTGGEVQRITALLKKADAELEAILQKRLRPGSFTTKRHKKLLQDITTLRQKLWRATLKQQKKNLLDIAKAEQEFVREIMKGTMPVQLDYAVANVEVLRAIVTTEPFAGGAHAANNLSGWWENLARADQRRIMDGISLGMVQSETTDQMVRRVRGATRTSRRNAEAIVRTSVNHITNASRGAFFEANGDIARALRWTSVLDGRTSMICRGRDGMYAPVTGTDFTNVPQPHLYPPMARPPAHVSCRSQMIAVLNPTQIARNMPHRPFVRDTRTRRFREKDFRADARAKYGSRWKRMTVRQRNNAVRRQREAWAEEAIGSVPAKTTYDQWLRRQSTKFQNEVLGRRRAIAFRKGLALDKYTDIRGKTFTLDELRAKFPEYFAGGAQ